MRVLCANLLDNAAHHGRNPPTEGAVVTATVTTGAGVVRLTVADQGPGIPVDERATVVERFRRGTAAIAAGSGLGMALVDQQVRIHGGTLHIGDAPGGGCRVTVAFPGRLPRGRASR